MTFYKILACCAKMAANRIPNSLASNLALLLITDDVQDGIQDCLEQNITHLPEQRTKMSSVS